MERNYVSWNLGCRICTDWVKSKSPAVRCYRKQRRRLRIRRMQDSFHRNALGVNQCNTTERCAQQCHKIVNCVKSENLRSKCSLQCAIITELSTHLTSSQGGKTFVTWANPKWRLGNERGDDNSLACKFNFKYDSQIMAYLADIFHICLFVCFWRDSPQWATASSFTRFLDHTQWRTTGGRSPLDEWSARRRDLYMTTHDTHNKQTSMPPVGFEPTISAGERPQTYALDRAATGTGIFHM